MHNNNNHLIAMIVTIIQILHTGRIYTKYLYNNRQKRNTTIIQPFGIVHSAETAVVAIQGLCLLHDPGPRRTVHNNSTKSWWPSSQGRRARVPWWCFLHLLYFAQCRGGAAVIVMLRTDNGVGGIVQVGARRCDYLYLTSHSDQIIRILNTSHPKKASVLESFLKLKRNSSQVSIDSPIVCGIHK